MIKKTFTLAFSALALTGSATAVTIQLDIGHNFDIGESGSGWNNLSAAIAGQPSTTVFADLVDDGNATTGIGMTYSKNAADSAGSGSGADYVGTKSAEVALFPSTATDDGFYFKSGALVTMAFTGLTDGQAYEFFVYSARGNNGGGMDFDALIGGVSQDTGSIASVYENQNAVTLSFTADATGTASLTALGTGVGGDGALNMVVLTTVPEPSSTALLGLGGLTLILRRRK